jgi:hypothetical protein
MGTLSFSCANPSRPDVLVPRRLCRLRCLTTATVEYPPPKKCIFCLLVPETLIDDCVRLCCSLCLLENDPSVIEPDVLSKDRDKFEASGDAKYVDTSRQLGKIGWNVGWRIEVAPHYRRPHMALVWTGRGRAVPRVVPRRGSVVHRELVEKVPSGFGE